MDKGLVFGFLLAFLLLQALLPPSSYASETRISVAPHLTTASPGSKIIVGIRVSHVVDLQLWQVAIKYDPAILAFTGAWYPEDNVFAGHSDFIPVEPEVNDTVDGYRFVLCGAGLLFSSVDVIEGVLLNLNFMALGNGETELTIGTSSNPIKFGDREWEVWYSELLDSNVEEMPFVEENGVVHVGGPFVILTVTAVNAGNTDPEPGKYAYSVNQTVLVSAFPDPGYDFSHWLLDGINVGSMNPHTVFMNVNHTVEAVFIVHPPLTWTVDDDGSADFRTIQGAVDSQNVTHGDIVFVKSGVYYEHIHVTKNLTIIGENKGTTVIDGNGTGVVVRAEAVAHWVERTQTYHPTGLKILQGFTIRNGEYGIQITSVAQPGVYYPIRLVINSIVNGNYITNNRYGGIYLGGPGPGEPESITVANNYVANNTLFGIHLSEAFNNTVTNNTIVNSGIGIDLLESRYNVLRENKMFDNRFNFGLLLRGGHVSQPEWWAINDVDTSNTVNGKPVYYWIDKHNSQIPSDAGYIFLYKCTNITVSNCSLLNNLQGILLIQTNNTLILENRIEDNAQGIFIAYRSSKNTLIGNSLTGNLNGIYLGIFSRHTYMRNNSINESHLGFGIYPRAPYPWSTTELLNGFDLEESDLANDVDTSNTIDGKPIIYWIDQHSRQIPENAGYVMLINSTDTRVEGLDLSNNLQGIIVYGSNHTVIADNTISNSLYGVQVNNLGWREWRQACFNVTVTGNVIYYCGVGVLMWGTINSSVSDNTLYNDPLGILFRDTDNGTISGNIITGSNIRHVAVTPRIPLFSYSVFHYPEPQNEWCEELAQAEIGGIFAAGFRTTVSENSIRDCTLGISTYDKLGNYWGGRNVIFHNNVINTDFPTMERFNGLNEWDDGYPSGGNYWCDYNGVDVYSGPQQNQNGSDGIGDKPYHIYYDFDDSDRYPLMNPWNLPEIVRADINGNGKVEVEDIYALVLSFGSCAEDEGWNSKGDLTGPLYLVRDGKVDFRDIGLASKYLNETH